MDPMDPKALDTIPLLDAIDDGSLQVGDLVLVEKLAWDSVASVWQPYYQLGIYMGPLNTNEETMMGHSAFLGTDEQTFTARMGDSIVVKQSMSECES